MSDSTTNEISESQWREHLDTWARSGLSQSAYCRREGVSFHRFRYWKSKLQAPAQSRPVVKLPVQVWGMAGLLEVVCGRFTVRVPGSFQEQTLLRVIQTLERLR